MEKIKNRYEYIDVLKSIGIILMTMGHINFGENFSFYIHAFHMPVFFLISGYLFKSKKEKTFIDVFKKNFRSLIIPYLFFGLFYLFIDIFRLILGKAELKLIIDGLEQIVFVNYDIGPLWFLTALFFVNMIYYVLDKYMDNYVRIIVVFIIFCIGINFYGIYEFRLPLSIDAAMVGIGLYEIGRGFKNISVRCNEYFTNHILLDILLLVFGSILVFTNDYINMRTGEYGNVILFVFNACIISFSLFYLCKFITNTYNNFVIRNLIFIGSNSIVYLCTNELIASLIYILGKFVPNNFIFLFKLLGLAISLILFKLITILLNNRKLKWIIGVN